MSTKKVAILGATSHIAKGLIFIFLRNGNFALHLHARSSEKLRTFIGSIGRTDDANCIVHERRHDLLSGTYDVIINCVGVGTAKTLQGEYSKYFTVTEEYDNLVLDHLRNGHADTLYISLSSGAVYGDFSEPANEYTTNCIKVNHPEPKDYYGIARLNAEAKHRSLVDLHIVDLRLFAYFSRFIDLSDGYFIIDVINSMLHETPLVTTDADFVRDFVHPMDLFSLVVKCIDKRTINTAFDVVSAGPVKKSELLEYFSKEYGLRYSVEKDAGIVSATGSKNMYYSTFHIAAQVGYKPAYTSLQAIADEAVHLLKDGAGGI